MQNIKNQGLVVSDKFYLIKLQFKTYFPIRIIPMMFGQNPVNGEKMF